MSTETIEAALYIRALTEVSGSKTAWRVITAGQRKQRRRVHPRISIQDFFWPRVLWSDSLNGKIYFMATRLRDTNVQIEPDRARQTDMVKGND